MISFVARFEQVGILLLQVIGGESIDEQLEEAILNVVNGLIE